MEKTLGASLFKQIHFNFEKISQFRRNSQFRKRNTSLAIPPDKWLFETFQLNYQKYFFDGNLAAKEILKWSEDFLPKEIPAILDWGCGTGRIVQHLHKHHPYLLLYGADTNNEMITWNNQNIKGVHFSNISFQTPTTYPENYFDLIYGISVFTHIPIILQNEWLIEMNRIIKPTGILLFTTMGAFFNKQLAQNEINQLEDTGIFEKAFIKNRLTMPGNRNYSVYEKPAYFEKIIEPYFKIIHFYDGSLFPEKFGGQDLWILQKK